MSWTSDYALNHHMFTFCKRWTRNSGINQDRLVTVVAHVAVAKVMPMCMIAFAYS